MDEKLTAEPMVQRLPLPKNEARLQQLMVLLLRQPRLLELRVTNHGIEVKRAVSEGEIVVPETLVDIARGVPPPEVDPAFMLSRLSPLVELEPDPERHPLTTLIRMTDRLKAERCIAVGWYVAYGDGLDGFVGNRKGTVPKHLFGVPVHYVSEEVVPEDRLVLVGSTTGYSVDASFGVTAEIGA